MNTGWRRMTDVAIPDLEETIKADVLRWQQEHELKFYVGCDSQVHGPAVHYTTAIVMHKVGNGALAYYKVDKEISDKAIKERVRERLWLETYKAVDIAKWVDGILLPLNHMIEEIHADLNPHEEHMSNCMVSTCLGYIRSMGFLPKIKPEGWAASGVADAKNK